MRTPIFSLPLMSLVSLAVTDSAHAGTVLAQGRIVFKSNILAPACSVAKTSDIEKSRYSFLKTKRGKKLQHRNELKLVQFIRLKMQFQCAESTRVQVRMISDVYESVQAEHALDQQLANQVVGVGVRHDEHNVEFFDDLASQYFDLALQDGEKQELDLTIAYLAPKESGQPAGLATGILTPPTAVLPFELYYD